MRAGGYKSAVALVAAHLERYPALEVRDAYKLLYQTFHGAEHAIGNPEEVGRQFYLEWNQVKPLHPTEKLPVLEPIFIQDATPPLYRVNLKPAKGLGVDPKAVLDEFLRAGNEFQKAFPRERDDLHQAFLTAWAGIGQAIHRNEIPLEMGEFTAFSSEMEGEGWPVVHHSTRYQEAHDPHYRLVMDPSVAERRNG